MLRIAIGPSNQLFGPLCFLPERSGRRQPERPSGAADAPGPHRRLLRRALLLAAALAVGVAWRTGHTEAAARAAADAGAELANLLRMMALIKAAMAVAALWLVHWRLGYAVTTRAALLYIVAAAMFSAGPVLMWQIGPIITGVALFHGGLATTGLLAWADGAIEGVFSRRLRGGTTRTGRRPMARR